MGYADLPPRFDAMDRKVQLLIKGVTLARIRTAVGAPLPSIGHVAYVIRGERRSKRIERAVARLLRLPVAQVFPRGIPRAAKPVA